MIAGYVQFAFSWLCISSSIFRSIAQSPKQHLSSKAHIFFFKIFKFLDEQKCGKYGKVQTSMDT